MTWVKISDGFPESDVFERDKVGAHGGWMHVAALAYCNRALTDGVLPRSKARRLIDVDDADAVIDALIRHGLWEADGNDVVIVNYLDDQPSAAKIEKTRTEWAAKKARWRAGRVSPSDKSRDSILDSAQPVPVRDKGTDASSAGAPNDPPEPVMSFDPDRRTVTLTGEDFDREAFAGWARVSKQGTGLTVREDSDAVVITFPDASEAQARAWFDFAQPEWVAA